VVRIEVTDTGYGIERKEMHRVKLFSEPFPCYPRSLCLLPSALIPIQVHSTKRNRGVNKAVRAPASASLWFGRSSN
jgi:hypothetical protein